MRICVLQPSYDGPSVDYRNCDPPRDLSPLLPEHYFHHAFLHKVSTLRQRGALRKQQLDVYLNLCEGYLDWEVPSVRVILALRHFALPAVHHGPQEIVDKHWTKYRRLAQFLQ